MVLSLNRKLVLTDKPKVLKRAVKKFTALLLGFDLVERNRNLKLRLSFCGGFSDGIVKVSSHNAFRNCGSMK